MNFDKKYWEERYLSHQTGWDTGSVTTPLKTYFDQLENKNLKILIPGAGNGHEVAYLWSQGFKHVYLLDITEAATRGFKQAHPDFPAEYVLNEDFWNHQEEYDLIVEQTFFCALDPALRKKYVTKMHELLKPGAKLVGLLWSVDINKDHPPFGGHTEEYLELFKDPFKIEVMENAYNSIAPRAGRELFIKMIKV